MQFDVLFFYQLLKCYTKSTWLLIQHHLIDTVTEMKKIYCLKDGCQEANNSLKRLDKNVC